MRHFASHFNPIQGGSIGPDTGLHHPQFPMKEGFQTVAIRRKPTRLHLGISSGTDRKRHRKKAKQEKLLFTDNYLAGLKARRTPSKETEVIPQNQAG